MKWKEYFLSYIMPKADMLSLLASPNVDPDDFRPIPGKMFKYMLYGKPSMLSESDIQQAYWWYSSNPNLRDADIISRPNEPWDWYNLSSNPGITPGLLDMFPENFFGMDISKNPHPDIQRGYRDHC
jgi:hypothetical protein